MPVIAAVHGVAYGAGLQLALGADIRFVAPDARLSIRETYWGLVPDVALTDSCATWWGSTWREGAHLHRARLQRHRGEGAAHRHARLRRPASRRVALAREIAARGPDAVRAAKKLLNTALFGSVADGLRLEAELQGSLVGGANQTEAVRANLEKRAPRFRETQLVDAATGDEGGRSRMRAA